MKHYTAKAVNISLLTLTGVLMISCESKSYENNPQSVQSEEMTVQERMDMQNQYEGRIDEVETVTQKIMNVLNSLRKATGNVLGNDNYTPVDFLLDLNEAFRGKLPQSVRNKSEERVSYSELRLPKVLSLEKCESVNARMISVLDVNFEIASVEYALTSCDDKDKYHTVASIHWDRGVKFNLDEEGIKNSLGESFKKSVGDLVSCTAHSDFEKDGKVLDRKGHVSVQCEDLSIVVNSSVRIEVESLYYYNYGEKGIGASAKLIENDILKALIYASGSSQGDISVEVIRVVGSDLLEEDEISLD